MCKTTDIKSVIIALTLLFYSCQSKTSGDKSDKQTEVYAKKNLISATKKESTYPCDSFITSKNCYFTNLSNKYCYSIHYRRAACDSIFSNAQTDIILTIIEKSTDLIIDKIYITSPFLYSSVFENCWRARSYITGVNMEAIVDGNDYGELVVADLNFDGKEDLAIIDDSGGNNGPLYRFYIQNSSHKFILDHFLTDSMGSFPTRIDSSVHQLICYGHSSAVSVCKHNYQYYSNTRSWKEVSRKIIDANHSDE